LHPAQHSFTAHEADVVRWVWVPGWSMDDRHWGGFEQRFLPVQHTYVDFSQCKTGQAFYEAVRTAIVANPRAHATAQSGKQSAPSCVVAWSMGAMVALDVLAALHEDIPLVIFGGSVQFASSDVHRGMPPTAITRMQRQLVRDRAGTLRTFRRAMWGQRQDVQGDEGDETEWGACRWKMGALIEGLHYLRTAHVQEAWYHYREHTLWIHGDDDRICPRGGVPAQAMVVPAGGHAPFWTQPQRCEEEMRRWMAHRQQNGRSASGLAQK
jgi:pimeloyl-[acyl-carrier protein] methyl ester esterase